MQDFKADLTGVDTSSFAKKIDLSNLKSDAYKLDTDKLKIIPTNLSNLQSKVVPVSVHLSKLSDVVKNVVKKRFI